MTSSSSPFSNYLKLDSQFSEHCYELLFHACSRDMSEHFLTHLFSYMIDSDVTSAMRELSARLVARLAHESVKCHVVHSTCFIRLPYFQSAAQQQEPIDYLLQTSASAASLSAAAQRKWKINLAEYDDDNNAKKHHTTDNKAITSAKTGLVYRESCHKVYCLRVPIVKATQTVMPNNMTQQVHANSANSQVQVHEVVKHSYSLSFMLRFDDNLINFSKAYGSLNYFL